MSALYLYAFAAMQFVVGAAVDAWGPRRAVAAGAVVMGAGGAVFAAAHVLPVAYGARVVVGVGASVVFIGTLKQIGAWFRPDEFGTWSGLTQVAGNLGGLLAAAPLALVVSLAGWRTTFGGVAALSLGLAVLCLAVVRDRPEDAGFPPPVAARARAEAERRAGLPHRVGQPEDLADVPRLLLPVRDAPLVLGALGRSVDARRLRPLGEGRGAARVPRRGRRRLRRPIRRLPLGPRLPRPAPAVRPLHVRLHGRVGLHRSSPAAARRASSSARSASSSA